MGKSGKKMDPQKTHLFHGTTDSKKNESQVWGGSGMEPLGGIIP
jgi:hypothetical protein